MVIVPQVESSINERKRLVGRACGQRYGVMRASIQKPLARSWEHVPARLGRKAQPAPLGRASGRQDEGQNGSPQRGRRRWGKDPAGRCCRPHGCPSGASASPWSSCPPSAAVEAESVRRPEAPVVRGEAALADALPAAPPLGIAAHVHGSRWQKGLAAVQIGRASGSQRARELSGKRGTLIRCPAPSRPASSSCP